MQLECDGFSHFQSSFHILPVTLNFSSFLSPPEKAKAKLLWTISPSWLSRMLRWWVRMLRGTPCHISFRPSPPTSRQYPNFLASDSSPMKRRNAMQTGSVPSRKASKWRQKQCPKQLKSFRVEKRKKKSGGYNVWQTPIVKAKMLQDQVSSTKTVATVQHLAPSYIPCPDRKQLLIYIFFLIGKDSKHNFIYIGNVT